MGIPVSVDSDDLEALIHAANAAVMVQQALAVATNDPAYKRCKPLFVEATERATRARALAIRIPSPDEQRPMDDAEFEWIRDRFRSELPSARASYTDHNGATLMVEGIGRVAYAGNPQGTILNSLRMKRLVDVANEIVAIRWRAGEPWEEISVPRMVFRLTARGEAEFERIERMRRAKA